MAIMMFTILFTPLSAMDKGVARVMVCKYLPDEFPLAFKHIHVYR
jgi:hypothetical protein